VFRLSSSTARAIGRPFRRVGKFFIRVFGVPIYRTFFFVRRAANQIYLPGKQRLVYLLTNRYAIHVLVAVIVFSTGVMGVQAGSLRSDDFGQGSMLYQMATGNEREQVQVVRADAILGKPTKYLGAVAVSVQPDIDFHFFDSDYVAVTAGGSAVIAQTISEASESTAARTEAIEYTIKEGDTMSIIAESHGITLTTLLWSNDLSVRSVIRPGDTLSILPVDGLQHTVKSGDTVLALAKKYDSEALEIVSFNRLANSGDLKIGEVLMIPGGTKPAAVYRAPTRSIASVFSAPSTTQSSSNAGSGSMTWPTDLRVITQYFGWRHTGLDVDCKFDNNNYAADDGIVQYVGWKGGYGLTVEINHGNGVVTRYAHGARNYVSNGQSVSKGEAIQLCGTTGRSTGTHIHFEVIVNGKFKNPLGYIR
jgi:murein DD-endopeptidase MepM/ murein hydrolase activator NlpD